MFSINEISRNVHQVNTNHKSGFEKWFLLTSDWHYDNPQCNRVLLHRHLQEAKDKDAGIFCFGDLFCAMQGQHDKRRMKGDTMSIHSQPNYFDMLVNEAAETLAPFAENIALISPGNHETAVTKNAGTNLIDRLAQVLNINTENRVFTGGYGGYIMFRSQHESGGNTQITTLKYFHGAGGGGPVTKTAIKHQRAAVNYPDADIVYHGHYHDAQQTIFMSEKINKTNNIVKLREQTHISGASYKEEYEDGFGGWHVERGASPKPLGGWWLHFKFDGTKIKYNVIRAK